MVNYTYSKLPTINFNTTPASVARSATGSVYAVGDTTYTTPLNMTLVVGGSVVTSISSDANGLLPDFTLLDRTSCVWKQTGVSFATVLTTTDPVPGPAGATGGTGATGAQGVPGDVSTWKATTFYPLNTPVTNPSGDLVKVTTAHTSTGSYDAAKFEATGAAATKLTGVVPDANLRPDLTVAALSATYARAGLGGLVLDVAASPYNAKGDGTTDDYAAINNAAAALETFGGGTLLLTKGTYRISAYLRPRAYVRYQGVGIGRTIIKPYQSAAFTGSGTVGAPIESPSWFDMTWDGSNIVSTNSLKGQFSEYLRNAHWERVECKNFTATGFGSDFLPGSRYINCIATGNGRGQAVGGPGMSGFGIGTGMYDVEDVLVQGCIATGNTNYGIFVEKQGADSSTPYHSKGVRFVNNIANGNAWGIGGCGVESPTYTGNHCFNNTYDGITLHEGSGVAPLGRPDKRATVSDNHCYSNGRDGINIDYSRNSLTANQARHIITGNNCRNNTRDGLRLVGSKWNSDVVRAIRVDGNKFTNNTGEGINIVTGASAESAVHIDDLIIQNNDVNGNTLNGIHISATLVRPVIQNNKIFDDQATKTQDYGILTDAGYTLTDALIQGNALDGNQLGPVQFNATWAGNCIIKGNKGYVPGWASITITATPVIYTCGITPETVYWGGGTTTAIRITPYGSTQATVILSSNNSAVPMEPGDIVQFEYSAAPATLKTMRRQ